MVAATVHAQHSRRCRSVGDGSSPSKVSEQRRLCPAVLFAVGVLPIGRSLAIEALEGNTALKERVEAIRLTVGPMMNLGDVKDKTVPKMTIVSPAQNGGLINTRSFIPHRVHDAVGVLAAASVAVAATTPGAVGHDLATIPEGERKLCHVEHPTGALAVEVEPSDDPADPAPKSVSIMRTARLLMAGTAYYIPGA